MKLKSILSLIELVPIIVAIGTTATAMIGSSYRTEMATVSDIDTATGTVSVVADYGHEWSFTTDTPDTFNVGEDIIIKLYNKGTVFVEDDEIVKVSRVRME